MSNSMTLPVLRTRICRGQRASQKWFYEDGRETTHPVVVHDRTETMGNGDECGTVET